MLDHVLIGALAGGMIQNSPTAFGFSTFIHLFLDKIPHYFPDKRWKEALTISIDLTLCTAALSLFWYGPFSKSVFWGGLGGIWLDLLLVGIPPIFHSKLGQWHVHRQPHHADERYIWLDVAVIATTTAIIYILH